MSRRRKLPRHQTMDVEAAPRATPRTADLRTTQTQAWAEMAGDFVFERDITAELDPALFHWHTYNRLVGARATANNDGDDKQAGDGNGRTKTKRSGGEPISVLRSSTSSSLSNTPTSPPTLLAPATKGEECTICHSGFADLLGAPCGHTFCEQCFDDWHRNYSQPPPLTALSGSEEAVGATAATDDCYECGICYNPFANPVATECGHTYCELCLAKWLEAGWQRDHSGSVPCPTCNKPIHTLPSVNLVLRTVVEARHPDVRRGRDDEWQDEAARHVIALWRHAPLARDLNGRLLAAPVAAADAVPPLAVAGAPDANDLRPPHDGAAERRALRGLYVTRRQSPRAHAEIVVRDCRRHPTHLGVLLLAASLCVLCAIFGPSVAYSRGEAATFLEYDRIDWLHRCANATAHQPPTLNATWDAPTLGFCGSDADCGAFSGGMRVAARGGGVSAMIGGVAYRPFTYRPSLLARDSSAVHPNESRDCVAWQPWRVWTLAQALEHQGAAYWSDMLYEHWCPTASHFLTVVRSLSFDAVAFEGGAHALAHHLSIALAVAALPRSAWWYLGTAPYVRTDPWLALLLLESALSGDLRVLIGLMRQPLPFPTWIAVYLGEALLLVAATIGREFAASAVEHIGASVLLVGFVWRSTALAPLTARLRTIIWVEAAILATRVA